MGKILGSLGWVLLAFYVCTTSYRLGLGGFHNPGPGFMPFLGGALMAALGLLVLIADSKSMQNTMDWKSIRWGKIAMVQVGIIAYAVSLRKLGFPLANFLVLVLFFITLGGQKWSKILLNSFLVTLIIYLIFELWMQTGFPKGLLGI